MFRTLRKNAAHNLTISHAEFECSRDGLIIRGTEYRPAGDSLPIAIVCHGFMAFQDTVRQYATALAEMGYLSFCFDFSGGCVIKGKSEGKTTNMSVMTETKDLEAVIKYAKTRPHANPNRILLMGCSQGGFVSALVAAKWKHLISKLVLFYPALCIPDDARAGKMMFAKFDPANVPELIHCGPMKLGSCYVTDVIGMDPYEEIKGYSGDVLIIHGTSDKIVPLDYSKRAYETYLRNSSDSADGHPHVTLNIIEGGKHGFSKKHDAIAIDLLKRFAKS